MADGTTTEQQQESTLLHPPVGAPQPGELADNPPIPDDDPTLGYQLTHCMLRIRDPKPTLHFYIHLMGMRVIFANNVGPLTTYYLGYPQTAAHRADPSVYAREMLAYPVLTRTPGLLELVHYHGSETKADSYIANGSTPPHLGFNHLGFTVPDIRATVERLRAAGVTIVKDLGQGPVDGVPVTSWEKEELGIATEPPVMFGKFFEGLAFIRDPDGYLIELIPQNI